MSDELNPEGMMPPVDEASVKKPGLLSTTGGKIVAVVVGLGVLGIIAGIAVAIVLFVFGSQAVDNLEGQIEQSVTETTEGDTSGSGSVALQAEAPAAEVANSEIFTFRDIFVPLIKPLPEVTTTTSTGTTTTTTDTVTPTADNTLYLDGVVTQNNVLMAVLRYNGASYTLGPGGVIPNSPWEVLRVSSTTVTMLYGDVQVTLSVGQGITK